MYIINLIACCFKTYAKKFLKAILFGKEPEFDSWTLVFLVQKTLPFCLKRDSSTLF